MSALLRGRIFRGGQFGEAGGERHNFRQGRFRELSRARSAAVSAQL